MPIDISLLEFGLITKICTGFGGPVCTILADPSGKTRSFGETIACEAILVDYRDADTTTKSMTGIN